MRVHIEPTFTADDWQLFTALPDCNAVAEKLNYELKIIVNSGSERFQVEKHMEPWLQRFSAYGASDSESRWFLKQVLDEIFGE